MLAKWWWRAKTEKGKLWFNILKSKYGDQFLTNPQGPNNSMSPIMKIIFEISSVKELKLFDNSDFYWNLGNGFRVKFWNDVWFKGVILAQKYKRLHSLT